MCLRHKLAIIIVFGAALAFTQAGAADLKPKYAPDTTPLSHSHEYLRTHPAPDFWALIPFYAAQQDESSCSVASTAMVVNGARVDYPLGADDKLVTQKELLAKVKHPSWHKAIGGNGIVLDDLSQIIPEAMKAYGVRKATIAITHADLSQSTRKKLHEALLKNEKSAKDFMIINFDQYTFTHDTHVGHVAPIGAYDAEKSRVLIFDPDREWYEPYWVSEEELLHSMATLDSSIGKNRGWAYIATGQ